MVEKNIIGGRSHVIRRYVKPNDKYIKDYDKNCHIQVLGRK